MRKFMTVSEESRKTQGEVKLPKRSTKNSSGYDIFLADDVVLNPGERKLVFTDVKAYMQEGEYLALHVRSSVGVKKGVILSNGTGIVDADYVDNESNEGNIGLPLWNTSDKEVTFNAGEHIAQGIFSKYYVVEDEMTEYAKRSGGFGSTNV